MLSTKFAYLHPLNTKTSYRTNRPSLMSQVPHFGMLYSSLKNPGFSIVMEYADNGDVF